MIGKSIYVFDQNRRRYRKDENGRSYGPPIYLEHWEKREIVGETSRSWILIYGGKVPKKLPMGYAWEWEDVLKAAYIDEHAYKISEKVRRMDIDMLIKIAELIGYEPKFSIQDVPTDKE